MGDRYNGWTNYETWNVALWIDNEEGSYLESRNMARDAVTEWTEDGGREPEGVLADALREWIEDQNPLNDASASTFTDLLNAALSEVNWYEIAENYCTEVREEVVS